MDDTSNSFLRLSNVGKRYAGGTEMAVAGVSMDVRKGEFVSLLGPSGSGKSTTLMMIAGFELPSEGRVLLDGLDIGAVPAHKRNFGMVFQNYALFPHMTAFENVAYPLRLRKQPEQKLSSVVGRYLEMVGLGHFGDRRPAALSGGQQQRVALARALVFEPSVVLMDEPLGALDKNMREQLQVEIKDLQRKLGITLIYVTHDQSEAMTMSDRIAVFSQGRIEQMAAPVEIYRRPATRFVGEFVGENNMITGRRDGTDPLVVASSIGQIRSTRVPEVPPGASVVAMVRPELVRLIPRAADQNGATLSVLRRINYGDRVMVEGRSDSGEELRVRVSAREAEACHVGARINVAWDADDVHVLAAS